MEFMNSYLPQLGAIGLMLFGLIVFSKYMFNYIMTQVKENTAENKRLEAEFRDYLIEQSKMSFDVISKNTLIYEKLMDFFSYKFTEYLNEKINETKKMSDAVISTIKKDRE